MADAIMDHVGGEAELVERARNAGIVTDYDDWEGKRVRVPAETLAAILDVLDQPLLAVSSEQRARSSSRAVARLALSRG